MKKRGGTAYYYLISPGRTRSRKGSPEKSGEMTVGSLEPTTFTNAWLNLSIQFPEEFTILSKEELQTLAGFSQDILINSGHYNKEQI